MQADEENVLALVTICLDNVCPDVDVEVNVPVGTRVRTRTETKAMAMPS